LTQWIIEENKVRRLLYLISECVGYQFDDADWDAVEFGLKSQTPYEYPIEGRARVNLEFVRAESSAILIRAVSEPGLEGELARIEATSVADILDQIERSFAVIPRPNHFTDYTHCPECLEYDELFRSHTLKSLAISDLDESWTPVMFLTVEGIRYWLPALFRLALEDPSGNALDNLVRRIRKSEFGTLPLGQQETVNQYLKHVLQWRTDLYGEFAEEGGVIAALAFVEKRSQKP